MAYYQTKMGLRVCKDEIYLKLMSLGLIADETRDLRMYEEAS